jgi:hypothetical protein
MGFLFYRFNSWLNYGLTVTNVGSEGSPTGALWLNKIALTKIRSGWPGVVGVTTTSHGFEVANAASVHVSEPLRWIWILNASWPSRVTLTLNL